MARITDDLGRDELIALIDAYDEYIQDANEERKYETGWMPVCVDEFYDCEFQELMNGIDKTEEVIKDA